MRLLRTFSTSSRLLSKVAPPSLGEIRAVDLEKYRSELSGPEELATELAQYSEQDLKQSEKSEGGNLIKSFLYGSSKAQREAAQFDKSFSMQLMRGKYVHEIATHEVHPGASQEYVRLLSEYNKNRNNNKSLPSRLVGAWRTVIGGDVDTFFHIWEYDSFSQLHHAKNTAHLDSAHNEFSMKLRPLLRSRSSEIVQEFEFWGGTPNPRQLGGIFELKTYDLKPGAMIDWEYHWRKGLEYRKEVMEPVGAWFSSIGSLNRVYHLWQFTDLQHRKISRRRSWDLPGWAETTQETVKLLQQMQSSILLPLEYSPLK